MSWDVAFLYQTWHPSAALCFYLLLLIADPSASCTCFWAFTLKVLMRVPELPGRKGCFLYMTEAFLPPTRGKVLLEEEEEEDEELGRHL